jgi:hypothetical protein
MAVRNLVFLACLLTAVVAAAQSAPDQLAESNSPITPIAIVANGGGDVNQTWGRPRVLQSFDDTKVLMYAQGLPDLSVAVKHDQIWLFRNPNTPTGWSTEYTLNPKVRILPAPAATAGGTAPGMNLDANYAHQWPYKMHGRYYMVAQEAVGDPASANFKFFLLGKSTDGVNWTWRRWMRVREGTSIDQITWKDFVLNGQTWNYGFMSGTKPGAIGIGAIRFRQDNLAGGDWAFDFSSASTALTVWSNNAWVTVPTCASLGDTSGYDFCMYKDKLCGTPGATCPTTPVDKRIDPDYFLSGRHPSFHRLARHANKLELWNHSSNANTSCGCQDGLSANNNTFTYRQITPPASLSTSPVTLIGTGKEVAEDTPKIRCMPAGYRQSRITPFRLEWTLDMLYSRTGDDKTNPAGTACFSWGWAYIVRTRLEVAGTP